MERLLSTEEVAEALGVTANTIRIWRHRGQGPVGYKYGREVRYRPDDVEAWLDSRRDEPSTADIA